MRYRAVSAYSFVLILLAACGAKEKPATGTGEASAAAKAPADSVLNISQGSDVLTMDPYFKNESPTLGVLINIFDPLTDVTHDLKLIPALAESWEPLGMLAWRFKLRKGVKFHDGNDFNAEDVKYTIERARDWPSSRQTAEVATIKEVRIVDPFTVELVTKMPDAILPTRLMSVYMMDKESSEARPAEERDTWLSSHPNGTGPYKLEDWKKDQFCLLTANESYWGGAPEVKKVKYLATSNDATRIAAFLNGQVDILSHVPVRDVDRVKSVPGYRVVSTPSLRLIYLGLDVGRDKSPGIPNSPPNPLKDLRVRQAIYAAINEDLIVEKIMNGQALAAGQFFPESVIGFDPSLKREPHDPEKAKRLLAEAGYANGFDIRLDTPNDRYVNDAQIAQAIASELAKVGIRVTVNAMPKARFFPEEEHGDFSFFLIGWVNPNGDGYGTFDHLLHTTGNNFGGANLSTNYSNVQLDGITEAAAAEFRPDQREKLLQKAVQIAMHDLPHIPLHFQMDIYAISERIQWQPRRDVQMRGRDVRWRN